MTLEEAENNIDQMEVCFYLFSWTDAMLVQDLFNKWLRYISRSPNPPLREKSKYYCC